MWNAACVHLRQGLSDFQWATLCSSVICCHANRSAACGTWTIGRSQHFLFSGDICLTATRSRCQCLERTASFPMLGSSRRSERSRRCRSSAESTLMASIDLRNLAHMACFPSPDLTVVSRVSLCNRYLTSLLCDACLGPSSAALNCFHQRLLIRFFEENLVLKEVWSDSLLPP